jgi:hypothetical protein
MKIFLNFNIYDINYCGSLVNGEALNEVKFLWIGALAATIIFATKTQRISSRTVSVKARV